MKRLFVLRTRRRAPDAAIGAFTRVFDALWRRTYGTRKMDSRGHLWRAYILRRFPVSNSNGSFLTLGTSPHACGPFALWRTPCSLIRNARSSWRPLPGK
jgi:hypothetical protein